MISRFILRIGLVGMFFLLILPSTAAAQITGGLFQNPLSLKLDPAFPRPGEEVKVELIDQGSVNYGSAISWYYGGTLLTDAANQRNIVVTAGSLGSSATIQAVLTSPGGTQEVTKSVIKPVYVDIVLEPQTYVPPFYLGRAVPSINSIVNATALITDGTDIGGANYFYRWQLNQTVLEGGPLRGGSRVSFEMPMGDSAVLILQVTDLKGQTVAERGIEIKSVAPRLSFYEISSLYGVSNRALQNNNTPLVGSSMTIRAIPYYLDSRTYNSPDIIEWSLGGSPVENNTSNPYNITLQGSTPGTRTDVGFHVRSLTQVLQGTRDKITISY